jgi:hypothetical protein
MPGVKIGSKIYVVDTHELWSLRLEALPGGRVRALLLRHRFYNDGGDAAAADVLLEAETTDRLDVLALDDLSEANRARFAAAPKMQGRMTQIPYRGWPAGGLSDEDYRRAARRLRGIFDYVIVREGSLRRAIPPVFHEQGIKVLSYQYLGALRRFSSQLTEQTERAMGLKDSCGQRYTAPRSPNGAWLLCDLRWPEVRARFVDHARQAVLAGFDGVFLDGYPVWPDATGRHGGHVPQATQSLDCARWQFLRECRQAIRAANPSATLGALGNSYLDLLGEADYVAKERMYFDWDSTTAAREFDQRGTRIRQDLDVAIEDQFQRYCSVNVLYGFKGISPISVQSSLHFLRRPTGLYYMDSSDFAVSRLDDWLAALAAVATQDDLFVTDIKPQSCWVHFEGLSTVWSEEPCVVRFSKPVYVQESSSPDQPHQVSELALAKNVRYKLLRAWPEKHKP